LNSSPDSGSIVNLGENELFAHEEDQESPQTLPGEISAVSPAVQVEVMAEEQVDTRRGSPDEVVKPALGPNVTSTQLYPQRIPENESDDELDLFGSYHRKPTPQYAETIPEPATTSPEPVTVDDDLADGEGDIDNEDVPEDDAFDLPEDIIVGQTDIDQDDVDNNQADETIEDDRMSIDQVDEAEDHQQSSPQYEDASHLLDTSDEALSVTPKEVDDRMDTQPDVVPATQLKAPIFAESLYPSEPLNLVSNKAPRPIFVLGPIAPLKAYNYAFDSEGNISPTKEAELSSPATLLRSGSHTKYSLPPLKSLPAEYNRKNKSKQRKREKERERNDAKRDTNDWTPTGLNKWAATINANPVWKKVSRATKSLSSREWAVSRALFYDATRLD
jgi:chromatin modification-related protein VID21